MTDPRDATIAHLTAELERCREVLIDARKWLNGQPDRSTCKAEFLNDLLENIDAALGGSNDKG